MTEEEWMEVVSDVTRVAWASALGKLFPFQSDNRHSASPERGKSRENSVGNKS